MKWGVLDTKASEAWNYQEGILVGQIYFKFNEIYTNKNGSIGMAPANNDANNIVFIGFLQNIRI